MILPYGALPLLLLMSPAPSAAEIKVTPQRIAGLPPAEWPIGDGGPAANARLISTALAWDRNGNLLIADSRNNRIRRLTPDGIISTVIDGARYGFGWIAGMAVDSKGNLFLSDGHVPNPARLLQISPGGRMTEIPGPGSMMVVPSIAVDASDNLYITDQEGGYVWKRSPAGAVQKIAGNGIPGLADQGGRPALQVTLVGPHSLAFDRGGNLLIADWAGTLRLNPDGTLVRLFGGPGIVPGIHTVKIAAGPDGSIYATGDWYGIQRWDPSGSIGPYAGTEQSGFSDGCKLSGGVRLAKYASLRPADMVLDAAGSLYVADNTIDPATGAFAGDLGRIRRIDPDGSIRTVAGPGSRTGSSPRPALEAILQGPQAIAADRSGNVFFAEPVSNRVYQITTAGQLLTIAGNDSPPPGEDTACYPTIGKDVLSAPSGLAVDAGGNLYISDTGNHRILRRSPDGTIATIAGPGDKAPSRPSSIAVDPQGNIYFVDGFALWRIRSDGVSEPVDAPTGISNVTVGFDGRLILTGGGLYKQTASGRFYPLLPCGEGAVAADPAGAIYIGGYGLLRVSPNCNRAPIATMESIAARGLAPDSQGNLYISDNNSIWRVPSIPVGNSDLPSPSLDSPGIFNAASNLTAQILIKPINPFHPPYPVPVNDSITGNEMVRIKGGCLGPLEPLSGSFDGGRLPTALAGTRVLVDGVQAPLLSVQSTEILAVMPRNVAGKSRVGLAVENQGVGATVNLDAGTAAPGIFVTSGTQAAAVNADATLNGPDHPAPAGSVVSVYLTGAGVTDPPLEDGAPPGPVPPRLAQPVAVKVGGLPADVLYAGAAPGLAGISQVNIRIPAVAASDATPIEVTVGGNSRNQRVTLAVR